MIIVGNTIYKRGFRTADTEAEVNVAEFPNGKSAMLEIKHLPNVTVDAKGMLVFGNISADTAQKLGEILLEAAKAMK